MAPSRTRTANAATAIEPKTPNQALYLSAIHSQDVVFAVGCAGTGKTFLALAAACDLFRQKKIRQIVITRPNVSTGEKTLGFFKGSKEEKIAEWMKPAVKILRRFFGSAQVDRMLGNGEILLEPLETMRGETFDDAFVLLDEAQNVTFDDLKMFLTRIGQNTKVVIDGDTEQTDLAHRSGLAEVIRMVQDSRQRFPVIEFGVEDVVRSEICKTFIIMFRNHAAIAYERNKSYA